MKYVKIGIITFQLAWNCGAVLQCYALQEYLQSLGHEAIVINYCPQYKEYRYKKYGNPFVNAIKELQTGGPKRATKKFVRTILNYREGSEYLRQWNGFKVFCEKYLNLTRKYDSIEALRIDPPDCDLYISGSDQLWNPKLTNGQLDEVYFLDFGNENVRRITYAISVCELNMDQYGCRLKELCHRLDAVSLREVEGKEKLEILIKREVSICPDPTFLVNTDVFKRIIADKQKPNKDYIVVYALEDSSGDSSQLFSQVGKLKERYQKEVLVITGPRNWPFSVTQIRGICPEEFLYYINNAFCVVNNSFHATVFSILFKKQFVTMGFRNRSARMLELLNNVGLQNRYYDNTKDIIEIMEEKIEYYKIERKIEVLRDQGTSYLKAAICSE